MFSCDRCLTGCGACSTTHYFHFQLINLIILQGKYLNQFELYSILIAVREWAPDFAEKNIFIYCDNSTSVQVLDSGCTDCTFVQSCLREIRFYSTKINFRIRAEHLPGEQNRISDCLSRWHLAKPLLTNIHMVKLTIKCIDNLNPAPPHPVTIRILLNIRENLDMYDTFHATMWALFTTHFFLLL